MAASETRKWGRKVAGAQSEKTTEHAVNLEVPAEGRELPKLQRGGLEAAVLPGLRGNQSNKSQGILTVAYS